MSIPLLPVFFKTGFCLSPLPSLAVLPAVQMVSQSQFFRGFYLLYLMRLPICWKNVRNFKQNFAQKEGNRIKNIFNAVALL